VQRTVEQFQSSAGRCGPAGGLRIGGELVEQRSIGAKVIGARPLTLQRARPSCRGGLHHPQQVTSSPLPGADAAPQLRSAIDCPLDALGGVAAVDEEVDVASLSRRALLTPPNNTNSSSVEAVSCPSWSQPGHKLRRMGPHEELANRRTAKPYLTSPFRTEVISWTRVEGVESPPGALVHGGFESDMGRLADGLSITPSAPREDVGLDPNVTRRRVEPRSAGR